MQSIHLLNILIKEDGWDLLGQGIKNSRSIKRLIINNCNLREKNNLVTLTQYLERQATLEFLDLQCNGLTHQKHGGALLMVIKEQYKMRDDLNWKLGLRNREYYNISQIGLKCFNLARNELDDSFARGLAKELETDVYLKCISLKYNNIGKKGVHALTAALEEHPYLLSLDLRNNPGFTERSTNYQLMKLIFLRNLREAIAKYHHDETRVKLEWVYPHAVGQTSNTLD